MGINSHKSLDSRCLVINSVSVSAAIIITQFNTDLGSMSFHTSPGVRPRLGLVPLEHLPLNLAHEHKALNSIWQHLKF